MKKTLIMAASALVLSTGAAYADHHKGKMFEKMDTDSNGSVSRAEFMAAHEKKFGEIDANGDGTISKDEAKAQRKDMKQRWKDKKKDYKEKKDSAEGSSE